MTQLRREKKIGREEWMEQNPERGEEEEEEEEDEEVAERGSVGRLRGKEMLHNQLSRVFSCSLFSLLSSRSVFFFFSEWYRPIHLCQPDLCLPRCLAPLLFFVTVLISHSFLSYFPPFFL